MTAVEGTTDVRVQRLVAFAGGCALGAFVGVQQRCPHGRWAGGLAILTAVVVMTLLGTRHARAPSVVAGWLLVGLLLGAVSAGHHAARLLDTPLRGMARAHLGVTAGLRLLRDPAPVTTRHGQPMWLVDATAEWVQPDGGPRTVISRPVLVFGFGRSWTGLQPGQQLRLAGRLAPARSGDTVSAVIDAGGSPELLGRPPWWQRAATRVRQALATACNGLSPPARALVPGLVLGVVTPLPGRLKEQFRTTGLSHLVAVSGENLAILFAAVLWLVRWAGLPRWARALALAFTVAGFVVVARPSPSVLRAAVMGGIAVMALLAGRRRRPLPALSVAVTVLLLVDPFLILDLGLQLSVAATAGIVLLAPRLADRFGRRLPRRLAAVAAVPVAAQLACTPLLLGDFGQLTPYAVPANLVAGAAVPAATLAGVLTALVAVAAVPLGPAVARIAALPAGWIIACARWFSALPGAGAAAPRWAGLIVAGAAVTGLLVARLSLARRRRRTCHP